MNKSSWIDKKGFRIAAPIVFGILFVLFWQFGGLHWLLHLRAYDFPLPTQIIDVFATQYAVLWKHTVITATEALVGLIIGSVLGFGVAVLASWFPQWGYGGLALMSAINAIPTTAMAPIMNNWFGRGMGSKIAVVIFFTMAAMAINTYRGLTVLPPFSLDLMKSYNATKKEVFFSLRLPNCVPSIFTALKVTTTTSMLSAIIAEFFSSYAGLGFRVNSVLQEGKNADGWAYIACSAIVGIIMYMIVSVVERRVTKWHASQR